MTTRKESATERFRRQVLRGEFKRSDDVMLYPLSLFASMETLLLPLPVYTSNRDYLTASPARRRLSILARFVQMAIFAALACVSVFVFIVNTISPSQGAVFVFVLTPLLFLFSVGTIWLSIRYTVWLVRHFRSQWKSYRN